MQLTVYSVYAIVLAAACASALVTIAPWDRLCDTGGVVPRNGRVSLVDYYCLEQAHARGVDGRGVKLALFDMPLAREWAHLDVASKTPPVQDHFAYHDSDHGNRCASIVKSTNPVCMGVSPGVELHSFAILHTSSQSHIGNDTFETAVDGALKIKVDIVLLPNGCSRAREQPPGLRKQLLRLHKAGVEIFAAAGGSQVMRGFRLRWDVSEMDAPACFPFVNSVGCVYSDPSEAARVYPFRPDKDFANDEYAGWHHSNDPEDDGRAQPGTCTLCSGIMYGPRYSNEQCRPSDSGGSSEAAAAVAGLYALQLSAKRQNLTWLPPEPRSQVGMKPLRKNSAIQHHGCGAFPEDACYRQAAKRLFNNLQIPATRAEIVPWEWPWDRIRYRSEIQLQQKMFDDEEDKLLELRTCPAADFDSWTESRSGFQNTKNQ